MLIIFLLNVQKRYFSDVNVEKWEESNWLYEVAIFGVFACDVIVNLRTNKVV